MAKQDITIGSADAKAGDTLFDAFTKTEANFTELYTSKDKLEGVTPAASAGSWYVSDGAGDGEFIRLQGWAQAADTDNTAASPSQTLSPSTRTQWTNDAGLANIQKDPSDLVYPLWDTTGNQIIPIAENDTYNIRVDFKVQNYAGSSPYITFELDIGGSIGTIVSQTIPLLKSGAEQSIMMSFPVFTGSTFMANGGKIYLTYEGTGTCDVFASSILIVRESKNYV